MNVWYVRVVGETQKLLSWLSALRNLLVFFPIATNADLESSFHPPPPIPHFLFPFPESQTEQKNIMLGIINSKRNTNPNPLSTSEMNNESSTAFSSRTNTTAVVEPMENSILPVFTLQPPSVQQQEPDSLKSRPRRTWLVHRIRESFEGDVHTEEATLQLAAFCFMSVSLSFQERRHCTVGNLNGF